MEKTKITAERMAPRYAVRIGDDGRAKSEHATLGEAREAARDLSLSNWSGRAQIVDRVDGWREWYEGGVVRGAR